MKIEINKDYIKNLYNGKIVNLPHGSGIDLEWDIVDQKARYIIHNSYHLMNENGFYDGWLDFYLTIPKENPINFKLRFRNLDSTGYYKVNRYMIREYLEDLFAYVISELEE